jgi:hypothetical protein
MRDRSICYGSGCFMRRRAPPNWGQNRFTDTVTLWPATGLTRSVGTGEPEHEEQSA